MSITKRSDLSIGALTSGTIQRILTNSAQHPRGIKVMLDGGIVGRVMNIKDK